MRHSVQYPNDVKQRVGTEGKRRHVPCSLRAVNVYDLRYGRDRAGNAGDEDNSVKKPQPRALCRIGVELLLRPSLAEVDMKKHACG